MNDSFSSDLATFAEWGWCGWVCTRLRFLFFHIFRADKRKWLSAHEFSVLFFELFMCGTHLTIFHDEQNVAVKMRDKQTLYFVVHGSSLRKRKKKYMKISLLLNSHKFAKVSNIFSHILRSSFSIWRACRACRACTPLDNNCQKGWSASECISVYSSLLWNHLIYELNFADFVSSISIACSPCALPTTITEWMPTNNLLWWFYYTLLYSTQVRKFEFRAHIIFGVCGSRWQASAQQQTAATPS